MATAQQCNALTNHYIELYTEKYGSAPVVNRNVARSQFSNVLQDMKPGQAKSLLDYYFTTPGSKNHDLTWFFYNYDKLIIARSSQDEAADETKKLREETKQRVKEWRERGRQGITNN